jgi:hypothetical protein
MIDLKILKRAILVGVVFELALVAVIHFMPWLRPHLMLFGCMLIAGVAGLLYARDLARGYARGALGGGVSGAASALVAVGVSNVLGDRPDLFMPYGVMVSALTGAIGGLFGQFDARLRALIRSL